MDQPKKSKSQILQEMRDEIQSRYNSNRVYRWNGYADDPKEKPLADLFETIASVNGFRPSYLYTIAVGEGLGLYTEEPLHFDTNNILKVDQAIDGFYYLGVDDFGSDYPRLKNYLPSDYNEGDEFYKFDTNRGQEFGRSSTNSAVFKDMESAIEGFSGMLKLRARLFERDYANLGYSSPTEDQIAFWTYVYYQGEGRAKRYLDHNKDFDYSKAASTNMGAVRTKALDRVATWRYIVALNIFTS